MPPRGDEVSISTSRLIGLRGPRGPWTLLLFLAALLPGRASAQVCPQGRISYIFIDNRPIFDTQKLGPGTRFLWAYRMANTLHIETREDFLREELLFETGQCLDPLLLEETERLLRGYRFITSADVFAVPQPDGTQHVVVDTQDEWTTRMDVGFRFEGGAQFTGLGLAEDNLLGRGARLRFFYAEDQEKRDMGIEMETPRLGGTRWDARISGGRTRAGDFFEETLSYPFVGEIGRVAGRQTYVRRETLFSYAIPRNREYSHILVPFVDERWDILAGGRLGRPGNLTVFGTGLSMESLRFPSYPGKVELVQAGDFSSTIPADAAFLGEIESQIRGRNAIRLNFFLAQRNLRFLQRRGLDAPKGVQDIQVGTEVLVGLGRTMDSKGVSGESVQEDLHTQIGIFFGEAWENWTLNTSLDAEARHIYAEEGRESRWEDIFAEADAYLYWQPGEEGPHTVLFRVSAAGGWTVQTPFQLTLGGRESLRGYGEDQFPGGQRLIFTVEDRIYLPWPAPELFDFGLNVFLDLGHIQPGGVPLGVDSGWRGSLGAGIRFGLPPGTRNTARIDLAAPLDRGFQFKDLILRVSLQELLGILPGLRDRQLVRSLRNGVRPNILTLPW